MATPHMATSTTSSDSLLPGKGHTPNYGITESEDDSYRFSKRVQYTDSPDRWRVVTMCALIACLASMVAGMSLSFSSIIISELSTDPANTAWSITTDSFTASLIGALVPVGAIFGGLFAWPVADYLGRQASLIIGGIPGLIGWLLISLSILFSSRAWFFAMIYIGRAFTGFSTGWSIYCVSVYIAEVASAKRKGLFGNCNQLFITFGVFVSYVLGVQFKHGVRVSFYEVALVGAGLVALFEVLMLLTYETPRWLFGKNKDYMGIKVLKLLRGPDAQIMREIDRIKTVLRRSYTVMEQLKEFRLPSVYRPFILTLMLMFFQQFSGINAAIFYSSTIFKDAGYSGSKGALISALAVGITQIIATSLSVLLVDRLGRRVLLITSSIGMCASSLVLAIFFYLKNHHDCETDSKEHYCNNIGYMAIAGVVVFIASFSIGWGPIPWSSMSELMPNRVRGLAASIATAVNWIFATTITIGFSHYAGAVTLKVAWGSFSAVMLLSIVCVALFLPETKGRSLEEIQEDFEQGQIFAVSCGGRKRRYTNENSGIN